MANDVLTRIIIEALYKDKASPEAKKTEAQFRKTFTNIQGIIGVSLGAYSLKTVMKFASELKNAARDATEVESKFLTVYSSIRKEAIATADEISRSFGLASSTTQKLLGDTGDLLTGFGYGQKEALEMSKRTTQLAIDLASFTNYAGGADGAIQALVKSFTGEREAIKALGIVIREEMVEEELLAMGKQNLTGIALAQAKAEATLNIAYRQSVNAVGDYVRTQDELANVERRRKEAQKQLAIVIGNELTPAFTQANLVLEEFYRRLLESDLETTIRQLRELGASAETLTNLEMQNQLLKGYDREAELKERLNKLSQKGNFITEDNSVSAKKIIDFMALEEKARQKKLNDLTKELIIEKEKEANLRVQQEQYNQNHGWIKRNFSTENDSVNKAIWLQTNKIEGLQHEIATYSEIQQKQTELADIEQKRVDIQKALNGEVEKSDKPKTIEQEIILMKELSDEVRKQILLHRTKAQATGDNTEYVNYLKGDLLPTLEQESQAYWEILALIKQIEAKQEKSLKTQADLTRELMNENSTLVGISQTLGNTLSDAFINGQNFGDAFLSTLKSMTAQALAFSIIWAGIKFAGTGDTSSLPSLGTFLLKSIFGGGFVDGGYTGNGEKNKPAGVMHKGEVVWSQEDVRKAGGPAAAEEIRRMIGRGYVDGGVVGYNTKSFTPTILSVSNGSSNNNTTLISEIRAMRADFADMAYEVAHMKNVTKIGDKDIYSANERETSRVKRVKF